MTESEFLISFRSFAVSSAGIGKSSAYCYVTYLHNACKLPGMVNHLTLIADATPQMQVKYAEELCDAVDSGYDDPCCILTEKDLNNSHTAVHLLLAQVSGLKWVKHKGVSVTFTHIFNKKSIAKTFKGRLRTQDRIYAFGAFPTNLISKLATRFKVRDLWDNLIAETKIVYDKVGNTVRFDEIDRIMFGDDGLVYFEKGGKNYTLFTKINKTGDFVELKTKKFKDLSLDHDIPVENALKKAVASGSLTEMKKLGDEIVVFKKGYKPLNPKAKDAEIIGEYEKTCNLVRLGIDERRLLNEMQNFLKTLSLTVMDRAQNSSKGKKLGKP